MTGKLVPIGLALASLTLLSGPAGAYTMLAVIEAQTQGRLACGASGGGGDGPQVLLGISDEMALATDGTGRDAGGALQVKPLVIVKELDRCSPPLFRALVSRERISRVEIRLLDRRGVHFFTIRLENASVTRITRMIRAHGLHEEVAFAFQTMELIDERSGASAAHDFPG
jgi:type VI secretion system Hcp family effector